ncbi:MAG: GCN5-like N-acetyltransferase [Rhizobacter sp.]|nr:GCN5-like N-acetyltransferase [Rhizobacter sp.]
MTASSRSIRPSRADDLPAIREVYAWNVLNGTGTFEIDAPSVDDMTNRWRDVTGKGLPWLVAEVDGRIAGYAYANLFRPRPAYRFCLEDSIYLAPEAVGHGLGRLLLAELIARCETHGARQMVAVIGDSDNQASINVHASLGFERSGLMKSAGRKFDRWIDVVLMQRALGQGDTAPPTTPS